MNRIIRNFACALAVTLAMGGTTLAQDTMGKSQGTMKTDTMKTGNMAKDKMSGDAAMKACNDKAKAEKNAMKRDEMMKKCDTMASDQMGSGTMQTKKK